MGDDMDEIRFDRDGFDEIIDEIHNLEIIIDAQKDKISMCKTHLSCETNRFEEPMKILIKHINQVNENLRVLKEKAKKIKTVYCNAEEENIRIVESLGTVKKEKLPKNNVFADSIKAIGSISSLGHNFTSKRIEMNDLINVMNFSTTEEWLARSVLSVGVTTIVSMEEINKIRKMIGGLNLENNG